MEHKTIRWIPHTQVWFCTVCGRTSDHTNEEDAQRELELYECKLPARDIRPIHFRGRLGRSILPSLTSGSPVNQHFSERRGRPGSNPRPLPYRRSDGCTSGGHSIHCTGCGRWSSGSMFEYDWATTFLRPSRARCPDASFALGSARSWILAGGTARTLRRAA